MRWSLVWSQGVSNPSIPNVKCGNLTVRWPLAPLKNYSIILTKQKARFPRGFRTFGVRIDSALNI